MTREYAALYASALLRGGRHQEFFEIAFSDPLETELVAAELEQLGCAVTWNQYRHFAVVFPPKSAPLEPETALLQAIGD